VSLDPLHDQVARIALALPEAGQVALDGGGAMLAHDLVDRPTQDVDLFTPDPTDMRGDTAHRCAGSRLARRECAGAGWPAVTWVHLTRGDYGRRAIPYGGDRPRRTHPRIGAPVVRPCAHADEVAAAKTLAVFDRAAARDLVDVGALLGRYTLEQVCELGAEKDAGFDRRVFADALAAAAAHSDAAFAEIGLGRQLAALRASTAGWRAQLLDAADMFATGAESVGGADGRRRCQGFGLDQRSATT
jgi:hypothetical protein